MFLPFVPEEWAGKPGGRVHFPEISVPLPEVSSLIATRSYMTNPVKSSDSGHPMPSREPRRLGSCRADFVHSITTTAPGPGLCHFGRELVRIRLGGY